MRDDLTDQKQFFHHLKGNSNAVYVCIFLSLHISFITVYNMSWPLKYDCPVSALWVFTVNSTIQVCPWGRSTKWKSTGFINMDRMRLQKLTQSFVLVKFSFRLLYICNVKVIHWKGIIQTALPLEGLNAIYTLGNAATWSFMNVCTLQYLHRAYLILLWPEFLESKLNSVHVDCHIAKYLMFQTTFVLCFLWLIYQAIYSWLLCWFGS